MPISCIEHRSPTEGDHAGNFEKRGERRKTNEELWKSSRAESTGRWPFTVWVVRMSFAVRIPIFKSWRNGI